MTSELLLLLAFVILSPGEPFLPPPHKPPRREHDGKPPSEEPCHFPFRYQRKMHNSCLPGSFLSPRPWCATTENYDRDQKWKYCRQEESLTGLCNPNPCQNGGACEARMNGFHCICRPGFHGRHCEKGSCFGAGRPPHLGKKDTWLQYRPPAGLQECRCLGNNIACKPVHGKACAANPCLNGGHCIELKENQVCGCPEGFSGPLCDVDHHEMCYSGNGHLYRGTTQSTASGSPCVPWDSPFLLFEYSSELLNAASLGLGAHPFCRNPDNDSQPWCYVLHNMQLTWEFCNVTRCEPQISGAMVLKEDGKHSESAETFPNKNDSSSTTMTEATAMAPVCGQRYTKTTSSRKRVVGGMVALPGSHPYMAALYIEDQFCGGSLISSCWILTAAHCFEFRPALSKISVVLGQTIYNTSTDSSVTLQVKNYRLHENYSPITKRHDIALVQLKETTPEHCVEFSHSISPVCLPRSMKTTSDATSKQCHIAGWGHMYEGADRLSVYLQEADMPIIPHEQCTSREVHGDRVTQDMLCAGYLDGRADACQGDSGGPLVCEEQDGATLHGIVSWGTGCAHENKPGVYTNVIHYLDWIQKNMH
nr:coagulation factor XII [Pogona vitticeps]